MNMELEREFSLNGDITQRFINVGCYLDVPISILIEKLNIEKDIAKNKIISILDTRCIIVINWLKNDKSKKNVSDYINLLENESNEHDFVRFTIFSDVKIGSYLKIHCLNIKVVGIDEYYIEYYKKFLKELDLEEIEFKKNENLKKILSDEIRPRLIYFKDGKPVDDDYETWFINTSF